MEVRFFNFSVKETLLTLVLAFGLLLLLPQLVFAQAGVSISPALIEETLDPGFEKQYSISIKNLQASEQTFYLSLRNISGVRDGGVPVFARDNTEVTGMELADWISLNQTEVTLPGNGTTDVSFVMSVPEDASPGSHFGGVFISVDPPDLESSGAAVGYQVANIVSIRVSGDVNEAAHIRQFSTDKFLYGSQDVEFQVRIENDGNVLIRPYGPLEIYNMLGQQVDTFTFNEDLGGVFPGRVRQYQIEWEGTGIGFGRYEAILSPVYGEQGSIQTMSSTVSFWVLPMNIIGPALGILAVLFLIVFISVRVYIHRTVAKMAPGRTRVVRSRRKSSTPSPMLLLTVVMLVVTTVFMLILLVLFA